MKPVYDAGIVGAGVLGLAHAYHLAKQGMKVIVFERHPKAQGASVRNFGMIWPIGQPADTYPLARRSREIWLEILRESGIWHRESGSMHLAYHDDEEQVLREFAERSGKERGCEVFTPRLVRERFPAVVENGLRAGLWSPEELAVDPRRVISELPIWLNQRFGVEFAFSTSVLCFDDHSVRTSEGEVGVGQLIVCTGADFRELAPTTFQKCGLKPCKLQMMRSQPYSESFRVGTHLAAGLTLRHYASFADCPTLPALARRLDAELPDYGRFGIHVLVSQNDVGELTLGDTHEYGDAIEPFDKPHLDELVLAYLKTFLNIPDLRIAERWHGIYVKNPSAPYVQARIGPNAVAVTGVGGAGMTLSFGLAEIVVRG